ncbi:MAG: AAA family ATPase [Planctomycetes bacterium]|jgi:DNA replication and repair protein RecF|nr:AAA family ATPase [Planctomycetota bacterium]
MAVIERLHAWCFRNLEAVDLELSPGVNWILGSNGAGKTALLEAVFVLSRGRSFRTRRFGPLLMRGCRAGGVEGRVCDAGGSARVRWRVGTGVAAGGGEDFTPGRFLVRLLCDATHALVEGDPEVRRRFLDWNLFHVEPSFARRMGELRRLSAQRNAWLRAGAVGPAVWDRPYVAALAWLLEARAALVDRLARDFAALAQAAGWFEGLELRLEGAPADPGELIERLAVMRDADRERGFTYLSPSRSDLVFRRDGERWVGSRGQTKAVGSMLQLAADAGVREITGVDSLWLVDDLDAELSREWAERLLALVRARGGQVLVTGLPGKGIEGRLLREADRMFHVEPGRATVAASGLRR